MSRIRSLALGTVLPSSPRHAALLSAPVLAMVMLFAWASPVSSQTADTRFWGTDDAVQTVLRVGNTLCIGGYFTHIGPLSGGLAPLGARNGRPRTRFPKVAGNVYVIVPDGRGGRYIGGEFNGVDGLPRTNLAHILADGSVAAWAPNPNSRVRAIVVQGRIVYVGGGFGTIGGLPREGIAAIDASSGRVTAWDPHASAEVWALLMLGPYLYVGGEFSHIGGQPRRGLAALDPRSGAATGWNPGEDGRVRVLIPGHGTILVGGDFREVAGVQRSCLAAVSIETGAATAWNPNVITDLTRRNHPLPPDVFGLERDGNTVYVGGRFNVVGGQFRGGLAAVDANTGRPTSWNPIPMVQPYDVAVPSVYALQRRENQMYISGFLKDIDHGNTLFLAAVDLRSGRMTGWSPQPVGGTALALSVEGQEVWAGGNFVGFAWESRSGFAALDATTGAVTDWSPRVEGQALAFARKDNTLYIGGSFQSVGGLPRNNLAAIDLRSHEVLPWNPGSDNFVFALATNGDRVFVGGRFTQLGGQPRERLAAVDAVSGAVTPWDPGANDEVRAFLMNGSTVYTAGRFGITGGKGRNGLAAIDATTGAVSDWNPSAASDGIVNAMVLHGQTLYVGGEFLTIGGQSRQALAALDTNTGLATAWNPSPNHNVRALTLDGDRLYVGGVFTAIGSEPRKHLAAFDLETGDVTPWNPGRDGPVRAFDVADNSLYVGGRFYSIGTYVTANLASLSLDRSTATLPTTDVFAELNPSVAMLAQNAPNPARETSMIRFVLPAPAAVELGVFDLQGRTVATLLDHELQTAGPHVVQLRTAGWIPGVYLYRLRAGSTVSTRKMLVVK